MADDKYTFEQARIRLEEIAVEVRKKDTSLEKSLDLLEEGVRLANICTDLVDHTDMSASASVPVAEIVAAGDEEAASATDQAASEGEAPSELPSEDAGGPELEPDDAEGFDEADEGLAEPADIDSDR